MCVCVCGGGGGGGGGGEEKSPIRVSSGCSTSFIRSVLQSFDCTRKVVTYYDGSMCWLAYFKSSASQNPHMLMED